MQQAGRIGGNGGREPEEGLLGSVDRRARELQHSSCLHAHHLQRGAHSAREAEPEQARWRREPGQPDVHRQKVARSPDPAFPLHDGLGSEAELGDDADVEAALARDAVLGRQRCRQFVVPDVRTALRVPGNAYADDPRLLEASRVEDLRGLVKLPDRRPERARDEQQLIDSRGGEVSQHPAQRGAVGHRAGRQVWHRPHPRLGDPPSHGDRLRPRDARQEREVYGAPAGQDALQGRQVLGLPRGDLHAEPRQELAQRRAHRWPRP
jgi:hypothetical protein